MAAQLEPRFNMHLVTMQNRYIIGFGDGTEDRYDDVSGSVSQEVIKLDT